MRTMIVVFCMVTYMGLAGGSALEEIDCSKIDFSLYKPKIADDDSKDEPAVNPTKAFFKRFQANLIDDKLKYIGEITRSSDVLDVDDKVDDSGDIKDQKSTETLFSIGYNYEINPVDIINVVYDLKPHEKKNYFLLGFIRLQNLALITKGAYSNTLLNELGEGVGESVKTEEKFTYALGMKYTGCIGSLLRGKIGCIESYSSTPKEVTANTEEITLNKFEIARLHCLVNKLEDQIATMSEESVPAQK